MPNMDWRWVEDFVGAYQVNAQGDVRSVDRRITLESENRGKNKQECKGKVLTLAPDRNGYLCVGLYKHTKQKRVKVHRLVAQAFIPNPENLPQVDHKDSDRTNNCVTNLQWVTGQRNMDLMVSRGRSVKGFHHHNAVLTPAAVLEIRRLAAEGVAYTSLAKQFMTTDISVRRAALRITWRSVE